MKNNKYAPYILGPILLILWGTIFYKIYKAVYPDEGILSVPNYNKLPLLEHPTSDSSFSLLLNYKDPFLGKSNFSRVKKKNYAFNDYSAPSRNSPQPKTEIKKTASTPKKPTKLFPNIVYQGYQFSEGDTSALLKVGQQFHPIVRVGQKINAIKIIGIYKDSIKIKQDSIVRVFIKSSK
jgi:hypothetical protein